MASPKMSTANFGDAAEKFVSVGISQQFLIPVAPPGASIGQTASLTPAVLGKAPGRYDKRTGTWAGLYGDILTRGVSRDEAAKFKDWPTSNVGILGAAYPAIDSDAQSPEAADIVHAARRETFDPMRPAIRTRGKNDRVLYTFRARDWKNDPVRTRHIAYELNGVESGLDVIGLGNQYLINGTHPSGDQYGWQEGDELYTETVHRDICAEPIDNADIDRFLDVFERLLTKAGGHIVNKRGSFINGGEYDPEQYEASMSVDDLFAGLNLLPNTAANFRDRDDLVGILSSIRAALGRDIAGPNVEDRIREWAIGTSAGYCDDAYFDKVWRSLRTVRVPRDSLERNFRRNGILHTAGSHFDDRGPELSSGIGRAKATAAIARADILTRFAARYRIGDVNTRDEKSSVDMRSNWDPAVSWNAVDWWNGETSQPDIDLVGDLNAEYGGKKPGFWKFIRALKAAKPDAFFLAETSNPLFGYGEIVKEHNPDTEITTNLLNMRPMSAVIRAASKPDPDPHRSKRDVEFFDEFGGRIFGKLWGYELDTLAFMAQVKKRPGHMLFLVGDSGVGKSTYTQFVSKIFNGSETAGIVDGVKMTSEGAARFAFAGVEGCRVISIRELPKGGRRNAAIMQQVTSSIKQMVDAGPEGDYFTIEDKLEKARRVRNFARIVASSNHGDAVEIEEGDRRIFMVHSGITMNNKPEEEYYENLVNIISDVDRLAGIYRWLLTRNIKHYSPNTPPPVSTAKAEQQVSRTENPTERHMRAALAWLQESHREAFDAFELAEIMRDLSAVEAANLGNGDREVDYLAYLRSDSLSERAIFSRGIQRISKFCIPINTIRSATKREPAAYALPGKSDLASRMNAMDRHERKDFLDAQYELGLCSEHPWRQFRKGGV